MNVPTCTHDIPEQESACTDGYCPLCAGAEIERLTAESERLWNVLSWIDTFDPETTAAAEGKFGLDLQRRAFQQTTRERK